MTRPLGAYAVLTSAVLLAGGCAGGGAPAGVSVADSAGVTIVTNAGTETAPRWSLSADPVVDIGSGVDPEVSLFRVVDVLPLGGGRVAIGMTAPPRVLVVGSGGAVEATLGQQGDGPGEFMGVGSVVSFGADSIAVWDAERRRISVFTDDGTLRREADLVSETSSMRCPTPNAFPPTAA